MNTSKLFVLTAVLAFASVISFFQVNSYWADKHHFNGMWIVIGIFLGLGAIWALSKVIKQAGGGES